MTATARSYSSAANTKPSSCENATSMVTPEDWSATDAIIAPAAFASAFATSKSITWVLVVIASVFPSLDRARPKGVSLEGTMKPWSTVSAAPLRRRTASCPCGFAFDTAANTHCPSGETSTPAGEPETVVVVTWALAVRSVPVAAVSLGHAESENDRAGDEEASAHASADDASAVASTASSDASEASDASNGTDASPRASGLDE
jgi:hypothetical protein